jgi:ribulose-5-phosphate 4-epimerase/fuculose-1-phosphate aldolase
MEKKVMHGTLYSSHKPANIGDLEWEARIELAALYRALARLGITDLIYNHITLRVPNERGAFLLNSYGMLYSEVTASNLFKVDIDGKVLRDPKNGFPLNPAGFVIHSAVHSAREDIHCVLHTHTRAASAISCTAEGLLPLSQQASKFYGRVAYHEFNGPIVDMDERKRLVSDLGSLNVMFLRNHGTLVCGATIAETFLDTYLLETACKIQVDAMNCRGGLHLPSESALQNSRKIFDALKFDGLLEWNAMRRLLCASGEDYAR